MILITHILIALSSVGYTAYTFFVPSQTKLRVSYGLVAATVASGTLLVVTRPVHIAQTCISGLTFVACSLVGIALAQYRLSRQHDR